MLLKRVQINNKEAKTIGIHILKIKQERISIHFMEIQKSFKNFSENSKKNLRKNIKALHKANKNININNKSNNKMNRINRTSSISINNLTITEININLRLMTG